MRGLYNISPIIIVELLISSPNPAQFIAKNTSMGELSPPPSSSSDPSVALVVGVTGMVGLSLVDALKKPAAGGGSSKSNWTVYGVARRSPPSLHSNSSSFPLTDQLDRFIELDVLDRAATLRTLSPLAPHVTHLFWVTLAERPTDSATSAANSAMLTNVLDALLLLLDTPSGSRLLHVALQTGTKHYYWACLSDPAQSLPEVPFKEETPRNPQRPLFYYDLEDILVTYSSRKAKHQLTWTVHRASLILGASDRSLYNVLLTLAAYALISRHEGTPFLYPGTHYTWTHFCDVSDADLLAEHQIWAARSAKNEAFNCTNGDVFTWRSFWKVLCGCLDVEFVEFVDECCGGSGPQIRQLSSGWAGRMREKGGVWDEIVRENGLRETKLEEITCFGAAEWVLNFGFQHVSSMNKSREYGFVKSVDTLKSVTKWVDKLRDMNIIPKHNIYI